MPVVGPNSERVLILVGRRRDADVANRLLTGAGFATLICHSVSHLTREMRQGAGCAIITEEAIDGSAAQMLHGWVEEQPTCLIFPSSCGDGTGQLPERDRMRGDQQLWR